MNNVRKLFDEYLYKKAEIARLKADKCIVTDTVKGSADEAPYTSRHITIAGVDKEKRRLNREKIEKLEAECAYVEAAVALAPNSRERLVLQMRYMDGMQWADVIAALESSGITITEAACKQRIYRYFATLEEKISERKRKAN